jgi:8-oxo-dGTP pyrophosphatase MutT (NUDIX family)
MKFKNIPNMVNVFIRNNCNHALIINNIKHGTDRIEFPGGKLERGMGLEEMAVKEARQELGIEVKLIKIDGSKIFGDYETQTPEGSFLCRTYHAEIISGEPKIRETKIHGWFKYAGYSELLILNEKGILVPNLVLALPKLKNYVD